MSNDEGSERVDLLGDDRGNENRSSDADHDDDDCQMFIPIDIDNNESDDEDLLVNPLSSQNAPKDAGTNPNDGSGSGAAAAGDIGVNGWLTKPVGMRRQLSASDIVFRSGGTANDDGIYNRPLDSRYDQDMNYNARAKTKSPTKWYSQWLDPESYREIFAKRWAQNEHKRDEEDDKMELDCADFMRRNRRSILSFFDSHPGSGSGSNWGVILIILILVTVFLNSTMSALTRGSPSSSSSSSGVNAVGGRYSPEVPHQPAVPPAIRNRGVQLSHDQFNSYLDATKLPIDSQEYDANIASIRSGLLPVWDHIADVTEPFSKEIEEITYFFHIFRTGGTSLSLIMAKCFGLVVAHRPKFEKNGFKLMPSQDVEIFSHSGGGRFADIDLRDPLSVQRAKGTNLLEKADVLISSQLLPVSEILMEPPRYRGRMFTMMRHPIDRILGMWRHVNLGKDDDDMISLLAFSKSNMFDENGIVRYLTNNLKQEVTRNHLMLAMDILRQKCLIGMLDDYEESLKRYEAYFGWVAQEPNERMYQETCIRQSMADNKKYQDPSETEQENERLKERDGYKILMERNALDLELFEYAAMLYREQGIFFTQTHLRKN